MSGGGADHAFVMKLAQETHGQTFDVQGPPPVLITELGQLQLSDQDIAFLFGESPGFAFEDVKKDAALLWDGLRNRTEEFVCLNQQVRAEATTAVAAGAVALSELLVSVFGVPPGSAASKALAVVATWLTGVGLEKFCAASM